MSEISQVVQQFSVWILPIIIAVTMHEAAHGFVARLFGDRTATIMGRVTLNPIKHIDPIGTILLPAVCLLAPGGGVLFGYAKPVPVNFSALRHPRRDTVFVALAGPGTNILLAIVSLALLHLAPMLPGAGVEWTERNLVNSANINVVLAILNMLPIPPLDGGRVLVAILPRPLALPLSRMEGKGIMVLLLLLILLPFIGQQIGMNLDIFRYIIGIPADWVLNQLATLTGVA
jgi:Zn-dependent protease